MADVIRAFVVLFAVVLAGSGLGAPADTSNDAREVIGWLLQEDRELQGIPFPDVVLAAAGKKVIPLDTNSVDDRELLGRIGRAMDEVLRTMNARDNPIHRQARINEVSAHFEDEMRRVLNRMPGYACDFPKTAAGKVQRSGYPDLRLVEVKTGRVTYLDPKLYEAGSRESSFRTFYFEPKKETGKILDDGRHLIVGIEHGARKDGRWPFTRWDLVDVSRFRVRLKAEFQGSNKDLYRPESIVGSSTR